MDRIACGIYFSNDDVKEKFISECANKISNIYGINEKEYAFSFTHKMTNDIYALYHYPMSNSSTLINKLQSIIFVIDDGWVDFDEIFNGVQEAKIDNIVLIYTGHQYLLEDLKTNCDIGAEIQKLYVKSLAKQIDLEDASEQDLLSLFESVKNHIYSMPFVINNTTIDYNGPTSLKCSGVIDYGFFQKGDRIAFYSKGGREVVGKVTQMMCLGLNPTRNAKRGQNVRFSVELEEKYFIEGDTIQSFSKDRVNKAQIVNAIVTMYDPDYDGYRTLDINTHIEFHLLCTSTFGKILDVGVGYLNEDEQRFKSVSSGSREMFSMRFADPLPLVNGMRFYIEKPWLSGGEPASYGYAEIVEVIE